MKSTVLIIGAGPAGLSAGLLLARDGYQVHIYESHKEYVGGLSRTERYRDYHFDIGGHRFFTKDPAVEKFWKEILKDDFLKRKRLSRIYYKKKFFNYPLKLSDIFLKMSPLENTILLFSLLKSKIFPPAQQDNLENWIISRFGKKLYLTFFKSYTEKVWGVQCHKLSANWAAQRINNLSITEILTSAVKRIFKRQDSKAKSLIQEFDYPKKGPGMLWEKVRDEIVNLGGEVHMGQKVVEVHKISEKWKLKLESAADSPEGEHVISSAPLATFIRSLRPAPPRELTAHLDSFTYRGFITVAIMFQGEQSFPDNWIYIHEPKVKVARIQNYRNWSEWMTPGPEYICYGLEYFCQENDSFWNKKDEELFKIALSELRILKLNYEKKGLDFKVIRSAKAYPVYDLEYEKRLQKTIDFTQADPTLHLVGRSGLHRYNNQDHSIKTAMITVENIKKGKKVYNPWNVNQDAEYIESSP